MLASHPMDIVLTYREIAAGLGALALLLALAVILMAWRRGGTGAGAAETGGRLDQMAADQAARETQQAERLQALERQLGAMMQGFGEKVDRRLEGSIGELRERLAVIDQAQKNLTDLSSQVVGLQDILSNKQRRGRFGEVMLETLIADALPASLYRFQATLAGGQRVDCLLDLPHPPGPIAIDAKFPLEAYRILAEATDEASLKLAGRDFQTALRTHILAIAEKYLVPGETADWALLFLPSEAVYGELHANFGALVEEAHRRRVSIVSPATLMALLTTVRAVLRDVQMREQAHLIQSEVGKLLEDVRRLQSRCDALNNHFAQSEKDLREIGVSADKIVKRGDRILQIETVEAVAAATPTSLLDRAG